MKIVIGSSMKYRDLVKKVMGDFSGIGISPLFPNIDYSENNEDDAQTEEEKKCLATDHYKAIDDSDVVYFITPQGYMGASCKLELGYAIAKNKPIYFSEPTNDIGLDCYALNFIKTNELDKFLNLQNK